MKIIFKQKKGFLLRDFVIVGILFGLIIALYTLLVASTADNYNNTEIISPEFAAHYNTLQTNLDALNISTKAVQNTEGINLIGAFNVAFNSVFTVIVMVWDGLLIYTGLATHTATDFSFLDQNTIFIFLSAIIACITAYVIFVWLSSVSRGKL